MFLGAKLKGDKDNHNREYDLATSAFNLFCRLLAPVTSCEIYSSIEDALSHPFLNFVNFGPPSDV